MSKLDINREEYALGMYCHLSAFLMLVFPFGNFIFTIYIYLSKRKKSEFINNNVKEAINFQISLYLVILIAGLFWWLYIGNIIAFFLLIYAFFEILIASVKANLGQTYRYKYSLRLIK